MDIQESQDEAIARINRLLRLITNLNESINLHHQFNDSQLMLEQDETLKGELEQELFELLAQMKITVPLPKAA